MAKGKGRAAFSKCLRKIETEDGVEKRNGKEKEGRKREKCGLAMTIKRRTREEKAVRERICVCAGGGGIEI